MEFLDFLYEDSYVGVMFLSYDDFDIGFLTDGSRLCSSFDLFRLVFYFSDSFSSTLSPLLRGFAKSLTGTEASW